ncbi:hypothetical protein CR513_06449, partial [Mucuna pruriens]
MEPRILTLICKLFKPKCTLVEETTPLTANSTLPSRSIRSFNDLATSFFSQFTVNRIKRLEVVDLFDIRQAKEGVESQPIQRLPDVEEAIEHGGNKDASREAYRSGGGPSRPARGRVTIWPVGVEARNSERSKRGS